MSTGWLDKVLTENRMGLEGVGGGQVSFARREQVP